MGTKFQLVQLIMKLLLALSTLLTLSAAEPTCEDCTAVVTTIATYLTAEESIGNQVEVLVAEVCPQSVDPDACVAGLPDFWTKIANLLWPGYWNPEADWMCAGEGPCGAAVRDATCEECTGGIQAGIDQPLLPSTISGIVEALSGEAFCGMEEDPDMCANIIAELIPLALPILAGGSTPENQQSICNTALPGTCPAL